VSNSGSKEEKSRTLSLSENKPFQISDDADLQEEDEYFPKIVCLAYKYLNLIPCEFCLQRKENMKEKQYNLIRKRKF